MEKVFHNGNYTNGFQIKIKHFFWRRFFLLNTKVRASPATRLFVFCLVYTNTSLYCGVAITKEVFAKTSMCQGETRRASTTFQFSPRLV